jgi:hypothetical protein
MVASCTNKPGTISTMVYPRPRSKSAMARIARWMWTMPTNVIGHAVGLVVSGHRGRRVGSDAARGWLYRIRLRALQPIGAITLGHVILASPRFLEGMHGRVVLAHELSHARQHDWLGPAYLPIHVLTQIACAVAFVLRPVPGSDPVHARNPLEQRWLCLGFDAYRELVSGERLSEEERERYLQAFGV